MENEQLFAGRRVRVYRNLHSGNFSVQCAKSGRVIARVDSISLLNATFIVRPAGRKKVLAQKKKNVHAFVVGEISIMPSSARTQVKYNPYVAGHFWVDGPHQKIESAGQVLLSDNKIFI